MNIMHRNNLSAMLVLLLLFSMAAAVRGQVIRLKSDVTVEPHQDVRLSDVATINATTTDYNDTKKADNLGNVVIVSDIDQPMKLKADAILMAIISQRGPEKTGGNLQISGAAECSVKIGDKPPAQQPTVPVTVEVKQDAPPTVSRPMAAVAERREKTPDKDVTRASDNGTTLTDVIKALILKEAGFSEDELSISFETISPQLDRPALPGQKWMCRPLTRTFIGTVQFEAQLVEGTKVLEHVNVQTKVQRWQQVVVLTGHISRGDVIAPENVRVEKQLIDRKMNTLFDTDKEVVGLESQRDLEVGAVLDQRDFRPALMAHKNEAITVIYMAGALQVQMRGRAMADAKLHESIQVRNESTGERYDAVVISKNVAVAGGTLTPEQEKKIKEGL